MNSFGKELKVTQVYLYDKSPTLRVDYVHRYTMCSEPCHHIKVKPVQKKKCVPIQIIQSKTKRSPLWVQTVFLLVPAAEFHCVEQSMCRVWDHTAVCCHIHCWKSHFSLCSKSDFKRWAFPTFRQYSGKIQHTWVWCENLQSHTLRLE